MRHTCFFIIGLILWLVKPSDLAHAASDLFQRQVYETSSFEINFSNTNDFFRRPRLFEIKKKIIFDIDVARNSFPIFNWVGSQELGRIHDFAPNEKASGQFYRQTKKEDGFFLEREAPSQCTGEPFPNTNGSIPWDFQMVDQNVFGSLLASAARDQVDDFVIYNDSYSEISYPNGDVHPMYGVCTDVVIRAYRALGIDLQRLVQQTRTGSGDSNIDHRRVLVLQRFFSRFGEALPITSTAEDYKAGDIVVYARPQNLNSKHHIAVVSEEKNASGRPLIIHNRGWGPQQEDELFLSEIIGHYRFLGLKKEQRPLLRGAHQVSASHPFKKATSIDSQISPIRLSRSFASDKKGVLFQTKR